MCETYNTLYPLMLVVLFTVLLLYLGVSELVLGVVYVQRTQEFLHGFPAVHKRVLWDRRRIQDAITDKEKYTWIIEGYLQ